MSAVGQQPAEEVIVQQPGFFQPNHPAQSGMFNNVVVEPVVVQTQRTEAQEESESIASNGWDYPNAWETDVEDCTEYG